MGIAHVLYSRAEIYVTATSTQYRQSSQLFFPPQQPQLHHNHVRFNSCQKRAHCRYPNCSCCIWCVTLQLSLLLNLLGIPSNALIECVGGIIGISVFTIPAITLPSRHATTTTTTKGRATRETTTTPGAAVSHMAHQWEVTYDAGKIIFPSMAAVSGLLYSYVAYAVRHSAAAGPRGGGRCMSNLYLTAAGLVVMIAPITSILVLPVNKKIEPYVMRDDKLVVDEESGKEDKKKMIALSSEEQLRRDQQDSEFPGLLRKWAQFNVVRGLFPAMGAVLGASIGLGLF